MRPQGISTTWRDSANQDGAEERSPTPEQSSECRTKTQVFHSGRTEKPRNLFFQTWCTARARGRTMFNEPGLGNGDNGNWMPWNLAECIGQPCPLLFAWLTIMDRSCAGTIYPKLNKPATPWPSAHCRIIRPFFRFPLASVQLGFGLLHVDGMQGERRDSSELRPDVSPRGAATGPSRRWSPGCGRCLLRILRIPIRW